MTHLRNVVRFTGLVVGVPTTLPHLLNQDGTPLAPDDVTPAKPGFVVTVNSTSVTVTRNPEADDNVDVEVHRWHSIGAESAPGIAAKLPFIPESGLVPFFSIWARSAKGFLVTLNNVPVPILQMNVNPTGTDPATHNGAGMLIMSIPAALLTGAEAAGWLETIPIQVQNGVISAIGIGALPIALPPSVATAGAAAWSMSLVQVSPSVIGIVVTGDAVLPTQWTARMGGTFAPHVAD